MNIIRCPRCKLGRMMVSIEGNVIETVCINCGHRKESKPIVDLYLRTDAPQQITVAPVVTYNVNDKPTSAIDIGK